MKSAVVHTPELVYHRKYPELVRVQAVEILEPFRVHFTFSDGVSKDVDPIGKTLAWLNDIDIDPDTLYHGDEPPPWMVEHEKRHKPSQARKTSKRKTVRSHTAPKKHSVTKRRNSPRTARPSKTAQPKPKAATPQTAAPEK